MRASSLLAIAAMLLATTFAIGCGGDDSDDGGGNAGNDELFGNAATGAGAGATSGMNGASGASGSNGMAGAPQAGNCADGTARTSRVTPRVTLVLDGSCSMSTPYPANGAMSATRCENVPNSRWSELRNALLGQNGVITRLAGVVEFGVLVFGTQPECPLTAEPLPAALDNFAAIDNAVPNRPPGMFTPTGPALDYTYNNLIDPPNLDTDRGPQIVLLATDGEPNSCGDATTNYQPSLDASLLGQQLGVTTYVVSLADAAGEFHDHLQQLANLGAGFPATGGEQAQLYEPTNPDELAAALEQLIGDAVGCDISLNGIITEGTACSQGIVTVNGNPLTCGDPNGWEQIDERHIRLVGSACEMFKNDASAILRADFGCGVFDPD